MLVTLVVAWPACAQELGLRLKLQSGLLPPPAADAATAEDVPMFIEADRVSGIQDDNLEAHGDVRLRQRGRTIFADNLFYSVRDEQLTATGNVRVDRGGDLLDCDKLFFDLRTDTGYAEGPRFYFRDIKARGKASKLTIESKTRYRAVDATYSTCKAPEKDWYLKVRKLSIDRDHNKGVARGAKLVFKDVPIVYLPYIDFPLSNARKSGVLSPTYGTTGQSGFEFTLPIYLNLAPNYDATIAPRVLAKRGLMLNNEFRYLGTTYRGLLNAEYLENDRERQGETRYGLAFRHNQTFMPGLSGYVNVQRVSDDRYFVDLSNRIAVTSQSNLPRDAGLNYKGGWWSVGARAQSFQTLQDPNAPIVPPYARLPQLTFTGLRVNERGFDLNLLSEYVSFSHPTLVNGQRAVLYPSVSYPLQTSFVTVVPKIGMHYTHYALDQQLGYRDTDRTIPIMSLDSTVTFERQTRFRGLGYTQTLEPRLYYVYIPFRDQSRLPVFDTALADFNMTQIFTENQFVGSDRINDANQLTGAVSSRLIDTESGQERVKLTVAERFYFQDQRVSLPTVTTNTLNRSDLLVAVNSRVNTQWYTDAAVQYNINDSRLDRETFALRYNPEPGKLLNLSYRYFRNSFEQTDISAQWPLNDRWSVVGRWAYSLKDRTPVATIGGVEYNAGCWVARAVMQQFVTFTRNNVRALFFQIEFNGLSNIGSNPLEILRQNVSGYQRLNALPQSNLHEDYYPAQ